MNKLQDYFQHYAERIAQANGGDATCTIVEIRGEDCLYELNDGANSFRGWFRDGESINDIKWEDA